MTQPNLKEKISEDDIYDILINQLPMNEYLSIPSYKLKNLATAIKQLIDRKLGGE